MQLLLREGPTTYSMGNMRDAMNMALRTVASYGLTAAGITLHVPNTSVSGFMKRAFEVCQPYIRLPAMQLASLPSQPWMKVYTAAVDCASRLELRACRLVQYVGICDSHAARLAAACTMLGM